MRQCDHCGKRVANGYAEAGWLYIRGAISRSRGYYGQGSYATDYLGGDEHDFCSIECLTGALDKARTDNPRPPADACRHCGAKQ